MIRFDGYYVYEPLPFLDKKEENIVEFSIKAFLFCNDGRVISAQKWTNDENGTDFSIENFKEENGINHYTIENNELCLKREVTSDWISNIYFDRISDKEFVNRQTGRFIKFVPWKESE